MQDQYELFVFASPEVEELLADNRTDLVQLLQHEGLEVCHAPRPDDADCRRHQGRGVVDAVPHVQRLYPQGARTQPL